MLIRILLLILCCCAFSSDAQRKRGQVNPTGTYKVIGDTYKANGVTFGYTGEIRVKLLSPSRVAISFFLCKVPSFNSGSFVDTLNYRDNIAIYTTEDDSTCKVTFTFSKNSIGLSEETADVNFGCGFGHGVIADVGFKKISTKMPVIKDLLRSQ